MLLAVSGFSKRFGKIAALDNVSFHVQDTEVLGLIGPNGAGKSTLFECLAGLQPRDSGTVRDADGRELTREQIAKVLFYVPDGIAPWADQPVGWILDYVIGFYGGRAKLRARIVEELALKDLLGQPIGTLSKGQRKRALIGVGLLAPQRLLLIDEPFDGLDLRQMRDIAAALKQHAIDQRRTLFLSIHQISDAARFCDRFVLLSGGRTCGEGTIADLAAMAGPEAGASGDLEEVFLALT